MLRTGLWGLAVLLALGSGTSPALAKTGCRRLCRTALRACRPASKPCVGTQGAEAMACRKQARTRLHVCRTGVLATCRTTGACS